MRSVFPPIVLITITTCFAGLLMGAHRVLAQQQPSATHKDLEYAKVDGHSLKLDLYLPDQPDNAPLVVWIHGGGWRGGNKDRCPVSDLTEQGYAVASIAYRLTDKATFPAQIHDCKGAVRWLRAHANQYHYRRRPIAVAGSSAGGHLAALLGTTSGDKELEGTVGGNLDYSSRVDAIVDYFGPTDFVLRAQSQPDKTIAADGPVSKLLGGPVDSHMELARSASPAFHVTADDPPLMIFHGRKDTTVLLAQSERIEQAYQKLNLPVTLHILDDAKHGGPGFFKGENRQRLVKFLDQHLRSQDASDGKPKNRADNPSKPDAAKKAG